MVINFLSGLFTGPNVQPPDQKSLSPRATRNDPKSSWVNLSLLNILRKDIFHVHRYVLEK